MKKGTELEFEDGEVATVTEEKPIKDDEQKEVEGVKDTVNKVAVKPNTINGSINDIVPLPQKEFNTWIRQCVVTGLAKYGEWINYKKLEKSVHNHLRGQFRKKVGRAAKEEFVAIGYWKTKSGEQRRILCLREKDPQYKAALTVFKQNESKKFDNEIEDHRKVLKERSKEIDERYETIKKNPTDCLAEVRRLEVVIEALMNERSRLIQAAMDKDKVEKDKSMSDYIDRLEDAIDNLPNKIPEPKDKVTSQDGLEFDKTIDEVSKSYKKPPGGLRIKSDTMLTQIGKEAMQIKPNNKETEPIKKKGFLSRIFG